MGVAQPAPSQAQSADSVAQSADSVAQPADSVAQSAVSVAQSAVSLSLPRAAHLKIENTITPTLIHNKSQQILYLSVS